VVDVSDDCVVRVTVPKKRRRLRGIKPRHKQPVNLSKVKSAITNGSAILDQVDHRSPWMRRFRDLMDAHTSDLGSEISESEIRLVRRCAMLTLQLEMMETRWAANEGEASEKQISTYQTVTNTLRRTLESLGLQKRMKTVQSFGTLLRDDAEQQQRDDAETNEQRRVEFEQQQREQRERGVPS
jgi:hypothetical protein